MNSTEDLVRSAIKYTAAEITEQDLAPLNLKPGHLTPFRGAGGEARTGRARFARGLAPIGAAAALLALIVGSVVWHGHQVPPSMNSGASRPLAIIPRYLVELVPPEGPGKPARQAEVVNTLTGKVVVRVDSPNPGLTFKTVAAAADDRTFVLAALNDGASSPPVLVPSLWELKFSPRTSSARLFRLRPRVASGSLVEGLALSPDGTEVAVATQPPAQQKIVCLVSVYSMRTGAVHQFTGYGEIGSHEWDSRALSWSANDRTLAYSLLQPPTAYGTVGLLNTAGHGSSLAANTRTLFSLHAPGIHLAFDADLTPNGKLLIGAATAQPPHANRGAVQEIATADVHAIATLLLPGTGRGRLADVLWTNRTGSLMIVEYQKLKSDPHPVFVLSGSGKLTPLPAGWLRRAIGRGMVARCQNRGCRLPCSICETSGCGKRALRSG